MVVSELKMKIEMLESKLQMREEQIDSLKAELNRLNTFLMLERRSVFAHLRDYLVVLYLTGSNPRIRGLSKRRRSAFTTGKRSNQRLTEMAKL